MLPMISAGTNRTSAASPKKKRPRRSRAERPMRATGTRPMDRQDHDSEQRQSEAVRRRLIQRRTRRSTRQSAATGLPACHVSGRRAYVGLTLPRIWAPGSRLTRPPTTTSSPRMSARRDIEVAPDHDTIADSPVDAH